MTDTRFKKGHKKLPGAGRKKGQQNGVNALVKAAMIKAATLEGEDCRGKDGLVGYMRDAKRLHGATFLQGIWKLLPKQVDVHQEGSITIQITPDIPARAAIEGPATIDADAVVTNGSNGKGGVPERES